VKYLSTRGTAPVLTFDDVLLAGLASDGGLYVPERWPTLAPLDRLAGRPYAEVAFEVMWPYVAGTFDKPEFEAMVRDSYATFDHEAVVPLRQLGPNEWLLELFHGPTLAFKDVALQLVGRLFDAELRRRGERVTILVATSGDTGSAAIEACRGRDAIDIVVLHPRGRVSEVQRRQMTTVLDDNVHNLAVDGTFDDCQDLVKAMFADRPFRDELRLSAMNSINWARVMPQIAYYVTTSLALGGGPLAFAVPTGNFGNVYAAWVAKQMGVAIEQLVVASNVNDILTRFLRSGRMEMHDVVATTSPSMDIQVSSNFERLLFELDERNGHLVAEQLTRFRADGAFEVTERQLSELLALFGGARVDDEEAAAAIRDVHERTGELIDPHTAVGVGAARRMRRDDGIPMVIAATAHPAKFPDAVEAATGIRPALPARLAHLLGGEERMTEVANDVADVEAAVRAMVSP
jgi:threonine synthase